jgi:CDP-glycerol glycerophosphotransferase
MMFFIKAVTILSKLILSVLFLPFWWIECLIPRDKHIFIFGSWLGKKYSDNTKALFEYILNNANNIKPFWITHDKTVYLKLLEEKKPVLMSYSLKGWLMSLRASVAFVTHYHGDINMYALHGVKKIWLWHGMPLKKVLCDERNPRYFNIIENKVFLTKLKQIYIKYIKPYYFNDFLKKDAIDATVASADFFVPFLTSAFSISKESVWLTGLPRTDFFYNKKKELIITELEKKYINSRIILYMPTFRMNLASGDRTPYNPFIEKSFNLNKFIDFLEKENIIFIYKPHFQDQFIDFSLKSDRFILISDSDYDELYVLISNIDILITDYSSVYFDFLCLNKPVILTPFDYEDYIKKSREFYFDYNILTSIKAYNWDELMNIIAEKKYYVVSKEETDKFCIYNDGHASERCLQNIIELLNKK